MDRKMNRLMMATIKNNKKKKYHNDQYSTLYPVVIIFNSPHSFLFLASL
jgi:hypothetical protein